MLSFATEFPARNIETDEFVQAVCAWLRGSPHTRLQSESLDTIPASGRWKVEADRESLEALIIRRERQETAAFKHISFDGAIEWTTTIVFSKTENDDWIGVRTARESSRPQISLPPARKPLVVKTLLGQIRGGLDGELYVSDLPFYLQANDLGMATRLLNSDADNYLPVVYVSCGFSGELNVDPQPLARVLGGMAHVLVEPDREFSRLLQADVGSRNVYGGRVGVYWPNGERFTYYLNSETPTEYDVRSLLASRIRQALQNRRPLLRCTWSQAEAEVAREAFKRLRESGSVNVDEYAAVFDSEIAAKDKQLEEAETEVQRLKSQLRGADNRNDGRGLKLDTGTEQSYFDGEVTEIVRDAICAAVESAQAGSRRQHVLSGIAGLMPRDENMKTRRDALKEALRQYRSMDRDTRKELERLGFTITEDGKHYKAVYMQDDRYTFAIPKSGGDFRGGLNAASDIGKRIL